MPHTSTFAVGTTDTPIVTTIMTPQVTIAEDASVSGFPTTDYTIKLPSTTATAIQKPTGTSFTINCPFGFWRAGFTVGYVKAISGATTFQQIESGV